MTKRAREEDRPFFSHLPVDQLEPSLAKYVQSKVVQTAEYNKEEETYKLFKYGSMVSCGGIHSALWKRYYKHYKSNRSKRKWRTTDIKGSTKETGIRVDSEMVLHVMNAGKKQHKYTTAILEHIRSLGHIPQAAQLPVEVMDWAVATQCDFITRDSGGLLHVWEVKTGIPVGGFQQQGFFTGLRDADNALIKCTGYNIWQLQLHFTARSLAAAGVRIGASHIIQVYESKQKGLIIKVHEPEPWTLHIK